MVIEFSHANVTVNLNPAMRYQTIRGWEATLWADVPSRPGIRDQIIHEAVNDLGLTRLRFEPGSGNRSEGRRWEWTNDDQDPFTINWAGFDTAGMNQRIQNWLLPFKQEVETFGDSFNLYISPSFFDGGSSGEVPPWLLCSAGEYAEFALSSILHLQSKGIPTHYYSICNEAGNGNAFTSLVLGRMIKTLGPRLQTLGLPTTIEFPEGVSADATWNHIQTLQSDPQVWPHIGVITYHLYGGNGSRPSIYNFALSLNLPTGQTEYIGANIDHLYDDLTLGGVSYWAQFVLAGLGNSPSAGDYFSINYNLSSFTRTGQYWNFRQVMHYVRPEAIRIEAFSDSSAIRPLAFEKNGEITVILLNNTSPQPRIVDVLSLPPGTYGTCQTINSGIYQELGLKTIGSGETLSVNLSANGVLTIYPYQGSNQPSTLTDWRGTPNFLTLPSISTTLSASATDPELDTLSYRWSVTSQPGGASVNLLTPDSSTTQATGLSVAGDYIFTISVTDGQDTTSQEVLFTVFPSNESPHIIDLHNRIPVMITLPVDSTRLRGGGWDLENDPLSYQWTILSQPSGASVNLPTPTLDRTWALDMTEPGNYLFQFEVMDPTHTVADTLMVPVYPVNTPPIITNAYASPDTTTLPNDSTFLFATTSDPDSEGLSHWWSVTTKPAGAMPIFFNPGSPNTVVRNLNFSGIYLFTLTVVDQSLCSSEDVTVLVLPVGVEEEGDLRFEIENLRFELLQNHPNPFQNSTVILYQIPLIPPLLKGDQRGIYSKGGKGDLQDVQLKIYDITGRMVETLVNQPQEPGVYQLQISSHQIPSSGIYFYRLEISQTPFNKGGKGDFTVTRRLTLIR